MNHSEHTILAADIGGTHARFALAHIDKGAVLHLDEIATLETAHFSCFEAAYGHYVQGVNGPVPSDLAMAVASPVEGETLKMTNNPWIIRPGSLKEELGLEHFILINDFAAVGHAVAQARSDYFEHVCGPRIPLPSEGTISVIGPGTGLGVSQVFRQGDQAHVIATEGGHIDFAPLDEIEDAILEKLRHVFGRVSVERVLSGPGLLSLYEALATISRQPVEFTDQRALWAAAISGSDAMARDALDRFCRIFGSVCGDLVLAHGSKGLVLAGGLVPRMFEHMSRSGFAGRFVSKGRFEPRMAGIGVCRITHPHPGLFGAAAAYAGILRPSQD